MITYKYNIQNTINIESYLKPYNNVVRYAYNRFRENPNVRVDDVVRLVQTDLKHIDNLDFSLIRNAVIKAESMKDKDSVIFGSRKLFNAIKFFKYKKNPKIPLDELKLRFNDKRYNKPLLLIGCCSDGGNRKAELDVIDNNSVIIKFNRKTHISVELPKLSSKHKEHLSILQNLCEQKKASYSIEINNTSISIIFDEKYISHKNLKYSFISDRILSIDLNPNYIGLSICDWHNPEHKTIIHKEIVDITKLSNLKQQYLYKKHKRDYETSEVNRHVINLAKHYKCELIVFEKLDIKSKDHSRGKRFNRLVNNCWNRTKLLQNLIKRCNIQCVKYQEVVPEYSSFIGQILHNEEYDSVAASLELSRRAYLFNRAIKQKVKPRDIVYPKFDVNILPTRWKEMVIDQGIRSWKKLYASLKKSKIRYRFLFDLENFQGISLSLNSYKSLVMIRFV